MADAAEKLELPAGTAGLARVTLMGPRRALVENHRGLAAYSPERVDVQTVSGGVSVTGEGLELEAMDAGALLVTGRILSVELD